ncbi:MAG: DNA polymerase III, subunit gamma and tau [Phycisphaerae bacterium]|nr:DNA polymerase III, subunit gamma and tau [Phycisphaerae bacterium]
MTAAAISGPARPWIAWPSSPGLDEEGFSVSYTVLARRYRPRHFEDLVGQEAVSATLSRAIDTGRIAHAYLFCGTRGVGKTTSARIFAAAINAPEDEVGLASVREAIFRGEDLDVQELDGASNRGINEAKDVIARSAVAPMGGRKRICIIDEVHMLTREAFNALLKTMEEPPAHAMFILCTTDPEKMPATILSRCQRYDFRPVSRERLAAHLHHVLEQEGVKAEPEALEVVAEAGRGSVRDALSILDRVLSANSEAVTVSDVRELLGLSTISPAQQVAAAIAEADVQAVLHTLAESFAAGAEPEEVASDLASCFRDAMLFSVGGPETVGLHLSDGRREDLEQICKALPADYLASGVTVADQAARAARTSSTPRAVVEAMLLKLVLALGGSTSHSDSSSSRQKKKPEQVHEVKPMPEATVSPKPAQTPPTTQAQSKPTSSPSAASTLTPRSSSPADSTMPLKSSIVVGSHGWGTFLASLEGDTRSEVRVEAFGSPTFTGDVISFRHPDSAFISLKHLKFEQDWLQEALRRFGMDQVTVQVAAPQDPESLNLSIAEMRVHPMVQKLTEVLEGEVVGVQPRSEAR